MKIINNLKPTGTYIQQITQGQVFTVDTYNFFMKVSENDPINYGVSSHSMQTLSEELDGHYLGIDLETGELASFARNTVVIPVPNFMGRIEENASNV
jgi:hypothetical protein